jgi:HAD superfamily hydrolase (TIGR01509 family)
MIKLIIFDLDGVLVDTKNIHYEALNDSLPSQYKISWEEHLQIYDGLKTKEKLSILTQKRGLPNYLHKQIWENKQKLTTKQLKDINYNPSIIVLFKLLKDKGYDIAVCSNSIRMTVDTVLNNLKILPFIDLVLSNEDVVNCKPHPEIYWKAISFFGVLPNETLIIEDSPNGLLAAQRSGSNIYRVKNSLELPKLNFESIIDQYSLISTKSKSIMWQDPKLNVLIPMAGSGSRFEKAGYTFPKPLIDIHGKPMIQVVVENLNFNSPHTFIVQKSHNKKYNLSTLLPLINKNKKTNILEIESITEGAACTTLLAKNIINNENPLIIANSDQYVHWNCAEFMYKMQEQDVDAGILTFRSTHPKWSFVKLNNSGYVCEVAEKNPISDIATVGIYYWRHGSDYVKYAKQMISKNKRYNNEFYVCPVFNEAIEDGKKIKCYEIKEMWGLGTPEDLEYFLHNYDIHIT